MLELENVVNEPKRRRIELGNRIPEGRYFMFYCTEPESKLYNCLMLFPSDKIDNAPFTKFPFEIINIKSRGRFRQTRGWPFSDKDELVVFHLPKDYYELWDKEIYLDYRESSSLDISVMHV